MKSSEFDSVARACFGDVLSPIGFSTKKSRYCTFYRNCGGVWHFVMPDPSSGGLWFDVRVFASSPSVDPAFESRFPDDLGIPSGLWSFLHTKSGVGPDSQKFRCRTREGFLRNFESLVKPALAEHALPYLDQIKRTKDMIPHIKNRLHLGFAYAAIGRDREAQSILVEEKSRLTGTPETEPLVQQYVRKIDQILNT